MGKQLHEDVSRAGKAEYVRTLFDDIADQYDFFNLVMSGGLLKLWHRAFRHRTGLQPGGRALDICCGTGDLTIIAARQVGPDGHVTGLDFSEEMLAVGERKITRAGVAGWTTLVQGDALNLPFAADSFDAVSIGFAMRNVADINRTLAEMTRVVRPGGRVLCLEISRPMNRLLRGPFLLYFYHVVPLIDRFVRRVGRRRRQVAGVEVKPYTYLPHSLTHFPDQDTLAGMFRQAGLTDVRYYLLTGGVVTLHVGVKPATQA